MKTYTYVKRGAAHGAGFGLPGPIVAVVTTHSPNGPRGFALESVTYEAPALRLALPLPAAA